ncbi:MORN repeat-containing protein [Noumeavirus]|uniref:MORN repeat-containing protein n=1 Tax=Noumeavirus TaxID=1955558 RepID=UPI000982CEC4|nr:MORN repeat-containing protein [Noumeavirus]AQM73303.1 MORN repeat-containing protein [Noumeavirus]
MDKFLEKRLLSFAISGGNIPKKEDFLHKKKGKSTKAFLEFSVLPNGQRHGKERRLYNSGEILECEWKDGKLHGSWKCFVGDNYLSGNFFNGVAVGTFRSCIDIDGFADHSFGKLRRTIEYTFSDGLLVSEEGFLALFIGKEQLFRVDQPKRVFLWDMKNKTFQTGEHLFEKISTYGFVVSRQTEQYVLSENHLMHFLEEEGRSLFATLENGERVKICMPIFFWF